MTDLLDTLEPVNKTQRFDRLRWTLGHVYDISPANIARAKALGMTLGVHGAAMQAGARMPLRKIADSGIVFGLGTDATIVSHYTPFVTLGWVVSGLDVGGNRVLDETLTREEALIAHTRSNAYLFFQENALGSLEVGKQADLVVLDRDYMTVPAARDQAHPADADDGRRASGLQRSEVGRARGHSRMRVAHGARGIEDPVIHRVLAAAFRDAQEVVRYLQRVFEHLGRVRKVHAQTLTVTDHPCARIRSARAACKL